MKDRVISAYKNFLIMNMVESSQENFTWFSVIICTSCGKLKDDALGRCTECDGTGGITYQDIPPM